MIRFSIVDSTRKEPVEIRCNNLSDALDILCALASRDMAVCTPEDLTCPVRVTLSTGVKGVNAKFTLTTDDLAEIADAIAFLSRYGEVRWSEC